jgi:bifunctional enzyme CysN/CysC
MPKEIFKITSAGSVDDGKSTILARLLLDTGSIFDDQISKDFDPEKIADLLDGLESEREQGITIDVAHRFFDSNERRYQIADSPGHEQYTRNMATACAGSDALMLVVDAKAGLKPQTLHHLEIALRLGIREILFVINKMDLVGFSKKVFDRIAQDIDSHITKRSAHFSNISHAVLPVSGLQGHNIVKQSSKHAWFEGPTLLGALDALHRSQKLNQSALFQVQYIQRLSGGGRRYLGSMVSGELSAGQKLFCDQREVTIKKLLVEGEDVQNAKVPQAFSLEINQELDLKRGQIFSSTPLELHDQFETDLIWLSEHKGQANRKYLLKAGSALTPVVITKLSQISLESNEKTGEIKHVDVNQIVRVTISTSEKVALSSFADKPELGKFILCEPSSGQTIAVGTVNFALRRSENITRHDSQVTNQMHADLLANTPKVIWFTGLSGSGKSTIAGALSAELHKQGRANFVLDGDNLRFGINRDLGFTEEDRTENIRRTAGVAALMADSGLIVLVALVSPMHLDRQMAKEIIGKNRFVLVYVSTPLEVCEARDTKGLYGKARLGQIPNFTGVTAPYELPEVIDFSFDADGGLRELGELLSIALQLPPG